ncbi:hypothetical protein LCGC14_0355510 [marine sediment metagenome]|uniref:Uncharacterized protein n=1 Tax=marine sediment metagenome TaxID=412755 RepID=A0A0F9VX00_9ZZZZ
MTETDISRKDDGTPLVEGHHINCCCPDCDEVHWNKFIDEARHEGYTAGRQSMQEEAAAGLEKMGCTIDEQVKKEGNDFVGGFGTAKRQGAARIRELKP